MQTYIVLLSGIAAMLFSASCSESDSPSTDLIADTSAGETSRVEILIPQNITRTHISDDGDERAVVEWDEGDQLVMWSKAVTGGSALSAPATFTYLAPAIDEEKGILFYCKEITIPANQSNYTYYAVSPVPESMAGAEATYTVPATQHGTFDEVPDILRAPAVEAKCLTKNIRNPINFAFEHVLHAMKITLPDVPFEEGIKTLRVEFPYAVAGKLTVNAETGEARISGNESKAVTLTFDTPKKAGDTFWVVVAPAPNGSEEVADVHFTAANADGTQFTFPTPHEAGSGTFKYNELTGGRITPVKLHLTLRPQKDFEVKVTDYSRLGEPVTNITSLTLPEGYTTPCLIPGTGNRTVTLTKENNTIRMFADVVDELAQNGKPLSAAVESTHAEGLTATGTVTASGGDKIFALTAPYLFSEDFSNVKSADRYENKDNDLASYNLPGWSGQRYGLEANLAAGINLHLRTVSGFGKGLDHGRMDTPFMTHLKAGANVTLSVSYDIGGSMCTGNAGGSGTTAHITYDFGMVTSTEASDGAIETVAFTEEPGTEGSYTNLPYHKTVTVNNCTQKHRLSWRTSARTELHGMSTITNLDIYLYLDNIKVSIVP